MRTRAFFNGEILIDFSVANDITETCGGQSRKVQLSLNRLDNAA